MTSFADFDSRGYPTVDVRTGYGRWASTYEATVQDLMDLGLLDALTGVDWAAAGRIADLGCGTGRTGAWLRGVTAPGTVIDGVDLTPEMLAAARERGAHDSLTEADVRDTGLPSGAYDLVITSLVDEHIPDLAPLYAEARRLVAPGGTYVPVSYHPHFIMTSGMPTHFDGDEGPLAITTNVHLVSDQIAAGLAAGWRLAEMREAVIDDSWLAVKPKWERFRGHPFTSAYVWQATL